MQGLTRIIIFCCPLGAHEDLCLLSRPVGIHDPSTVVATGRWMNKYFRNKMAGKGLIGFSRTLHNECLPGFATTAANRGRHPVWHSLQWLLEQAVKRTGTTTAYLVRPEHWSILSHSNCVTWIFQWTGYRSPSVTLDCKPSYKVWDHNPNQWPRCSHPRSL